MKVTSMITIFINPLAKVTNYDYKAGPSDLFRANPRLNTRKIILCYTIRCLKMGQTC